MPSPRTTGLILLLVVLAVGWRAIAAEGEPQASSKQRDTSSSGASDRSGGVGGLPPAPGQAGQQAHRTPQGIGQVAEAAPSSGVALEDGERRQTNERQTVTYTVDLAEGQSIVGQGFGINGQLTGCRVFLIAGPFRGQVTLTSAELFVFGAGWHLTPPQREELLAEAAAKQARQDYGCDERNQRFDRIGG